MTDSHTIEKWQLEKRYMLLDIVVEPKKHVTCCDTQIRTNKYLSVDSWHMIYKKILAILKDYMNSLKHKIPIEVDTKTRFKFEDSTLVLEFEFRNENERDILNNIFHLPEKELHRNCLHVYILDESQYLIEKVRELETKLKKLENIAHYSPNYKKSDQEYEYKPSAKKNYTKIPQSPLEYIPLSLNGDSNTNTTLYKPTKIDFTTEMRTEPYTPCSSLESSMNSGNIEYIPSQTQVTNDPNEVSPDKTCKRRRRPKRDASENRILNDSMTDDDIPKSNKNDKIEKQMLLPLAKSSKPKKKIEEHSPDMIKVEKLNSSQDLFGDDEDFLQQAFEIEENIFAGKLDHLTSREKLPRKSKEIDHTKSNKAVSPSPSPDLKRRKKIQKSKKKNEEKNGDFPKREKPEWLSKDNISPSASTSNSKDCIKDKNKNKENKKWKSKPEQESQKDKEKGKEKHIPPPLVVDREKLKEEVKSLEETAERIKKITDMIPDDEPIKDVEILNCYHMNGKQIMNTFPENRAYLKRIFETHKNEPEKKWRSNAELCYFTECDGIFNEEQILLMMRHLEHQFTTESEIGQYTEFFASTLAYEWALAIFMKTYKFERKEALERIRLQEKAHPIELSASFMNTIKMHKKKFH